MIRKKDILKANWELLERFMRYPASPMEPITNLTKHDLHQFECGSSCNYHGSSVQQSLMAKFMKHSSYMDNLNPRIYMNMMLAAALFSVSNMMCYQSSWGFNICQI